MCPVKRTFGKHGCTLKGTEHILGMLNSLGSNRESLSIGIQEVSGAQREQDGADERGNDDSNSIARCRATLSGDCSGSEKPG